MLMRSLVFSSKLQRLRLRCFSSAIPRVLKPGDVLRQARYFTEEDVLQYSKVTHDCNPLHIDAATARGVGFEGPLVHGMLVASVFPHIISSHFPGAVYVSQSLNFKFPVYIGDQVIGEVQATNLRENKNRYLAKFKTRCFKNGELLVIEVELRSCSQNRSDLPFPNLTSRTRRTGYLATFGTGCPILAEFLVREHQSMVEVGLELGKIAMSYLSQIA